MRSFSFNTMGEADQTLGEEAFIVKKLIQSTREKLYDIKEELLKEGIEIESLVEMGNPIPKYCLRCCRPWGRFGGDGYTRRQWLR
jgi:hypothetical protein